MLQRSIKSVLEITGQSSVAWQSLEGPTGTQGRRTFLPPPTPPKPTPNPSRTHSLPNVTGVTQNEDRIVVTQGEWIALSARLQGTGAKIKIPFYNFYKHDLQATSPWMMNTFWYSQLCGQLAMSWPVLPTSPPKQSCQPPVKMCHEQRNKN